jgi:hypothetical protein
MKKLSGEEQRARSDLWRECAALWQYAAQTTVCRSSLEEYLRDMGFRYCYKRCRLSPKDNRTAAELREDATAVAAVSQSSSFTIHALVLDINNIHRGAETGGRRPCQRRGFSLYNMPPYNPELNHIVILWKQAHWSTKSAL